MKNKKRLVPIILLMILIIQTPIYASKDEVDKYSKSSILIDQQTKRVLYAKNPDEKRPLASLSKMMTFLIAIEAIENGQVKANDIIKIDSKTASVGGSSYKLKANEEVPLIELMKGLMIVSGNDAAVAIAKHIGGDVDKFVGIMNVKAKEIGMKDTNFVNPHGLPIYDLEDPTKPPKQNISTARDIATLGKYMFDNYEKQVVAITDMETYSYPARGFEKNNTNGLLRIFPEVDGIKTGYTGNAGYCLSFSMKVNEDDVNHRDFRVIGVVLGATKKDQRMNSAVSILNYGKKNFETHKLIDKDEFVGKKYISNIEKLEVTLRTKDELWSIKGKNEIIKSELTLKEISYPIKKGEVIGVIKYYGENGQLLGKVEIISDNDVNDASLITRLKLMFND